MRGLPIAGPFKVGTVGRLDRSPLRGQTGLHGPTISGSAVIRAVLSIRHIMTAGHTARASPSKGRRVSQRAAGNTSVCQIPFGIRTRVWAGGRLQPERDRRTAGGSLVDL